MARGHEVEPADDGEHEQKAAAEEVNVGQTAGPHEPCGQRRHRHHDGERGHDQLPHAMLRPLGAEERHRGADGERRHGEPHPRSRGRSGEPAG